VASPIAETQGRADCHELSFFRSRTICGRLVQNAGRARGGRESSGKPETPAITLPAKSGASKTKLCRSFEMPNARSFASLQTGIRTGYVVLGTRLKIRW